jgi:hypothetical protein
MLRSILFRKTIVTITLDAAENVETNGRGLYFT